MVAQALSPAPCPTATFEPPLERDIVSVYRFTVFAKNRSKKEH
jgi:hypothetical protein